MSVEGIALEHFSALLQTQIYFYHSIMILFDGQKYHGRNISVSVEGIALEHFSALLSILY